MNSMSLPEGVTIEQVIAALQAQSTAKAQDNAQQPQLDRQQMNDLLSTPFQPALHINESNRNSKRISCAFCRTIILSTNTAQYEEKFIQLPALIPPITPSSNSSTPSLTDHAHVWRVDGQMSFENVGVSRPADPTLKYLICGECDRGPIGLTYIDQPDIFYVAHGTIMYT